MQKMDKILSFENAEHFLESLQPFQRLMMQYRCALLEVQRKFKVLNDELSLDQEQNPIESISCRIKKPISIIGKLRRKDIEVTVENIEKHLQDVAGIRVICVFTKDIYKIVEKICSQDDIRLVAMKDYIEHPKPNGYRSLHLILEVPVFFSEEKKRMKVEVQMRTKAIDFWASIEHKLQYKKDRHIQTDDLVEMLSVAAKDIHALDLRMQEISEIIDQRTAQEGTDLYNENHALTKDSGSLSNGVGI